jgi:hypothetical protein
LYAKLAGYSSVNAYTQSVFETLARQWSNHPEVQALLHKKAAQKTELSTTLSLKEVSINDSLETRPI